MDIKRVLNNDFIALIARSNEGKTMLICNMVEEYKKAFKGDVCVFGMDERIVNKLKVKSFNSLLELEKIKDNIIVIDEIGNIFDLENRKYRKQIDKILRLVNHNGNKLFISGLPTDFKKFICAKIRCYLFKGINISDLINGSLAKEILMQYKGDGVGVYSFEIGKGKVLCYDGGYFVEKFEYKKEYDLKVDNKDLFQKK